MARSTGPMLATGAITWANVTLLSDKADFDFAKTTQIAVATGLGVGVLSVLEKASPEIAVGLAYALLITVLLVRVDRKTPTPLERALNLVGG
jgi:uncharacterized membrane protein (DUF4010 family)